ncbi:MAG: GNAT family N-acetyltransferase [Luteitalea sp.]|nr:GNAT family N-acetyltransferase [Luteitalea sp.]
MALAAQPALESRPPVRTEAAVPVPGTSRLSRQLTNGCTIRTGTPADAPFMHTLIAANVEVGHLLPRTRGELEAHATRFSVIEREGRVVGCAELAPLSATVAEVRSLVVDEGERGRGLGTVLVEELSARARREGVWTLCAFTHHPAHFVRLGFSIVPHVWLPEKIARDCTACAKFRVCGQYAVVLHPRTGVMRPLRMARVTARVTPR